jgi:hypothetical protein
LGDGGLLSNVSAAISVSKIENGTSNVSVGSSGGNITFAVGATANVVVVSTTGIVTNGLTTPSITKSGANAVGNIGSSSNYFNQVFATATTALYADLAEKYSADAEYAPGTVVSFGGSAEVTASSVSSDRKIAGVISAKPSYLMNAGLEAEHIAVVALQGRVPCLVHGPVRKGEMMVSAGDGAAKTSHDPQVGSVIGKALQDFDGERGTIEIVVGRI